MNELYLVVEKWLPDFFLCWSMNLEATCWKCYLFVTAPSCLYQLSIHVWLCILLTSILALTLFCFVLSRPLTSIGTSVSPNTAFYRFFGYPTNVGMLIVCERIDYSLSVTDADELMLSYLSLWTAMRFLDILVLAATCLWINCMFLRLSLCSLSLLAVELWRLCLKGEFLVTCHDSNGSGSEGLQISTACEARFYF